MKITNNNPVFYLLKKILKWFLILLLVLNIAIVVTGKTYLYKGVANTYLKGRSGPSIDEYKIFENREVKAGAHQPLPNAFDYNQKNISGDELKKIESYKTIAYLIIQNDSVRFEKYWDNYSAESITNSFSMAKTFVGILVGCAIEEGKIKSLDQPVGDFLPEFKKGENAKLTVRHLLTMSSGINFDEDYINPFAYPAAAYYGSDLNKLTMGYEVSEEPGKVFKYLSGNTELLAFVIEKATGKKVGDYLSEKLWIPMGASKEAYWSMDDNNNEKAYCCFNSNARDFARFGELFLNKGNWKGKQLLPEWYVNESIVSAPLIEEDGTQNKKYGYSWWTLNYKGHHVFYARGILGQYIFVIPDKNMVVVRLGHKRDKNSEGGHPKDVYLYLDAALAMCDS